MGKPDIRIRDDFWSGYQDLVTDTVIPYQWEALNDRIEGAEPSRAIRNFRIAAGLEEGEFHGFVFQDSDLYKWLEAAAYSLRFRPNPELERTMDEAIELIGQAQHEDGYINTYYTIKEPDNRWKNLYEAHELYCAGHLFEAAVACHEATGKRRLLDIACRFADHIDRVFGPGKGQLRGCCGHPEVELALVRLYGATGEEGYLWLAKFFVDERGKEPNYFLEEWKRGRPPIWGSGKPNLEYNQAHLPVREQTAAVGHAVSAVYLYSAQADLARLTGDSGLREACGRLWFNATKKRMYITGGIGSTHNGEAFTFDNDLPNDLAYAETCASIVLIFWARRMLRLEARSEYADVMERALYNTVLAGMARDGKHFFYVNPLEVWPEASLKNPDRRHVKPIRQKWFGCSCCPPNVARLLASLDDYIYDIDEAAGRVHVHLYIGSEARFAAAGREVTLHQRSGLPWDGTVTFGLSVSGGGAVRLALALRVPDWFQTAEPVLAVNGEACPYRMEKGYAVVEREWADGDRAEWRLPMETVLVGARPEIRANAGRAAIQRGPLVYCVEEADNGAPLAALSLAEEPALSERFEPDLLGGCVVIEGDGRTPADTDWPEDAPYRPLRAATRPKRFRAIPYFLWGNREPGEMSVWIRR